MSTLVNTLRRFAVASLLSVQLNAGAISLETPGDVVCGFPAIFRLTVHGPARVERMNLDDGYAPVRLDFFSASGHLQYSITGRSRAAEAETQSERGVHRPDIALLENSVEIGVNEVASFLFDASSLLPTDRTFFGDIISGTYRVTATVAQARLDAVVNTRSMLTSSAVSLKILTPSPAETAFLERVRDDENIRVKLRDGVDWAKVLLVGADVSAYRSDAVTLTARQQMGLHLLMSQFLSGRSRISGDAIAIAQGAPLPQHVESEREALIIELKRAVGISVQQDLQKLVERHPDLKWRANEIVGGRGFVERVNSLAENRAQKQR